MGVCVTPNLIGKNGEAISGARCKVFLEHEMLKKCIEYNMMTDNNGFLKFPNLDLGFKNIAVICQSDIKCRANKWRLNQSDLLEIKSRFVLC